MTNYAHAIQQKFLQVEVKEEEEVPDPARVLLANTDAGRQSSIPTPSEIPNQVVLNLDEASLTDQTCEGEMSEVKVDFDAELDDLFT